MKLIEVDGDVVEMTDTALIFQPFGGGEVLTLQINKTRKSKALGRLPAQPRICRLTHDGGQVVKLEAFYLG